MKNEIVTVRKAHFPNPHAILKAPCICWIFPFLFGVNSLALVAGRLAFFAFPCKNLFTIAAAKWLAVAVVNVQSTCTACICPARNSVNEFHFQPIKKPFFGGRAMRWRASCAVRIGRTRKTRPSKKGLMKKWIWISYSLYTVCQTAANCLAWQR